MRGVSYILAECNKGLKRIYRPSFALPIYNESYNVK